MGGHLYDTFQAKSVTLLIEFATKYLHTDGRLIFFSQKTKIFNKLL